MNQRAAEVVGRSARVIVEKVNQFAASRLERRVALDRRLAAARDDDLEAVPGIIEGTERGDGANLLLPRPCRDDDGDEWQRAAHSPNLDFDHSCGKRKTRARQARRRQ